jgi:hypothetical protein
VKLIVLHFVLTNFALAKCAVSGTYHCAEIVFQKQIEAESSLKKDICRGEAELVTDRNKKKIFVAFPAAASCPSSGAVLQGHLDSICQDTGEWTKANSWFREARQQCQESRDERLSEVNKLLQNIEVGKTIRSQVEKKFLEFKSYDDSTHTMWYYEHPKILIGVSYSHADGEKGVLNKAAVRSRPVVRQGEPNRWKP